MGLDYSIELFFRIEDLETALLETIKIAYVNHDQRIDVTLPNGRVIQLPFKARSNFRNVDTVEIRREQFVSFETVLQFPAETDIRDYQPHGEITLLNGKPHLGIGYISLSISLGRYFVGLSYMAATTSMSLLFLNSGTIHKRFLELLELAYGVVGLIDDEEGGYRLLHHPEQRAVYASVPRPDNRYDANSGIDRLVDRILWAKENWE